MPLQKHPKPTTGGGTLNGTGRVAVGVLASFPTVSEFLLNSKYSDGSRRLTGTVTLCGDLGELKARVNDKDRSLVAFISGESLEAILGVLEKGIQDDQLDWREDKYAGKKGK